MNSLSIGGVLNKISHMRSSEDISRVIPIEMLRKHTANGGRTWFQLPDCVFKPDRWTTAFLRGLHNYGKEKGFDGKVIVELGTGSAVNIVLIRSLFGPGEIFGSDIHPDVPLVAQSNVSYNLGWKKKSGVQIIPGGHNLGQWMEHGFKSDVIIGCLPQVVAPVCLRENFTDKLCGSSSHYYCEGDYPLASKKSHKWGLGLNDHALKELRDRLVQGGHIILNLGGRPGKQRLLDMFRENGYEPRILHSETIEQHRGTSISTLVAQENLLSDGQRFEFFDESGRQISATDAEGERSRGRAIYHNIYVILGVKK